MLSQTKRHLARITVPLHAAGFAGPSGARNLRKSLGLRTLGKRAFLRTDNIMAVKAIRINGRQMWAWLANFAIIIGDGWRVLTRVAVRPPQSKLNVWLKTTTGLLKSVAK